MENKISFDNWIDITNDEHLTALAYTFKKGHFPENFIPENVEVGTMWFAVVSAKLALAYLDLKVKK